MNAFLAYFENIRNRTRRVIASIPPDQLEWTPTQGKFTFGDLIRHLAATERYMLAENVQGRPSRYPGHGRELAHGYQNALGYLEEMHAETVQILGKVGDSGLETRIITPAGISMTMWKWLRAMIEHEVHHRAQVYLMLGMLGVDTPPLYGLTSEEVRERSAL
ncbi:MAG: DinB family protein [Gemmatimonadetes bacterium]|nr:DinB family protein [Gemmatimonadota bacterium]